MFDRAALNSVTSCASSYFRTTDDPQMGKYAYESEGYEMLMSITRGLLGKKDWDQIGADLKAKANWYGHDSDNNWTYPTDPSVTVADETIPMMIVNRPVSVERRRDSNAALT